MHKHTARLTIRRAVTKDCFAASDRCGLGAHAVFFLMISGKPPAPDNVLRREGRGERLDDRRRGGLIE